eukprot:gene11578-7973_t
MIPGIFSIVGFCLLVAVSPNDVRDDRYRGKIVLFIAWIVLFGSTASALLVTYFHYTGMQPRCLWQVPCCGGNEVQRMIDWANGVMPTGGLTTSTSKTPPKHNQK